MTGLPLHDLIKNREQTDSLNEFADLAVQMLLTANPAIRDHLEIASIPHFFTAEMLSELLQVDKREASSAFEALTNILIVERRQLPPESACVKDGARRSILSQLRRDNSQRLVDTAARLVAYFEKDEAAHGIEKLYHLCTSDPDAAVDQIATSLDDWQLDGRYETLDRLGTVLAEVAQTANITVRPWFLLYQARAHFLYSQNEYLKKLADGALTGFRSSGDEFGLLLAKEISADIELAGGQVDAALEDFRSCYADSQAECDRDPDDRDIVRLRARVREKEGTCLFKKKKYDAAIKCFEQSRAISKPLLGQVPQLLWRWEDTSVLSQIGDAYFWKEDYQAAQLCFTEHAENVEILLREREQSVMLKRELALSYYKIAGYYQRCEELIDALRYLEMSRDKLESIAKTSALCVRGYRELGNSFRGLSQVFRQMADNTQGDDRLKFAQSAELQAVKAIGIADQLCRFDPLNADFAADYIRAVFRLFKCVGAALPDGLLRQANDRLGVAESNGDFLNDVAKRVEEMTIAKKSDFENGMSSE